MPNPIDIEQAYQQAVNDIETALSYRYMFARFFEFVKLLEGDHLKYQSYLVQLLDMLPVFTLPIMWSGLDPDNLARYADSIEEISEKIHREPPVFVVERLRQAAFLQYICLSEPVFAASELRKISGIGKISEPENIKPGESNKNLLSIKEWLKKSISEKERSAKEEQLFHQLIHDINILTREKEFTTTIPVVEHNLHGDNREAYRTGRLRNLALHESGAAENEDQIIRYFPVSGVEPVSEMNKGPVSAVPRRMAEAKYPVLKGQFYRAHLHYEINGANHDGQSSDAAVSALWFTYLTEKAETREHIRLTGQAAITGMLNEDGVIDGVDEDGIKWKVRAAFFSWIDYFVVPMSQYVQFEQCLSQLKKHYPSKKCTLIGVESVEDIFFDRRLAQYDVESRFRYGLKKFKKEKFKSVGLPLIFLLILIIARLMYGPVDRNPVIVDYEGSMLLLKNSTGSTISKVEIGRRSVEYFSNNPSHQRHPKFQLLDITKDGINELFYTSYVDRHMNSESFVRAWSVSGDSLIWEQEVAFEYNYPEQNAFLNSSMRVREMYILNTQYEKKLVFTASPSQYFQTLLIVTDLATGVAEQEFIHPGRIFDMLVVDLNDDGSDEMVLAGVSNAYWKAAIAVLEYRKSEIGYAPATESYIPEGMKPVHPSRYLLIPKSIIADYFEPLQKYNFSTNVNYDPGTKNLFFEVVEGNRVLHEYDRDAQVYFYFDSNLTPLGIGTSDTYDVAARDFYLEGKIPFEPDYDYFEALQDSILYWTGEEFVPTQEYFSRED